MSVCFSTGTAISIHAPARGATYIADYYEGINPNFNPRSREGSDPFSFSRFFGMLLFQSTLPRGERLSRCSSFLLFFPFQSTLPRGERLLILDRFPTRIPISIHAPARGATQWLSFDRCYSQFQSTLPRGERPRMEKSWVPLIQFQSTLPRGERQKFFSTFFIFCAFQSTLPRGERRL